jgi:hypothetical protein
MPKTISPALDAHRALGTTHLAWFVKATRVQADNAVYAFTTYPRPLTIDGVTYESGFQRTTITTAGDLAVDNLEIMGAMVSEAITEDDIRSGKWDGARIDYFEANANDLTQGTMRRRTGWLGEVRSGRVAFVAELHGLLRRLQQEIGRIFSPGCPWELGDPATCGVRLVPPVWQASTPYSVRQAHDAKTGSVVRPSTQNQRHFRCTTAGTSGGSEPAWNLAGTTADGSVVWTALTAYHHTLTVTAISDGALFFDSALGFADEWFSDGKLTWLTGLNAGTPAAFIKRSLLAGGRIELRKPMFFPIQLGDTALITAGCFRRRDEDCLAKFDNVENFGGFPDLLGMDEVITSGIA